MKAGVIDAAKVTRSALQNAASIAALFLTTEAVIADKPEPAAAARRHARWHARHGWHGRLLVRTTERRSPRGALRGAHVIPAAVRRVRGAPLNPTGGGADHIGAPSEGAPPSVRWADSRAEGTMRRRLALGGVVVALALTAAACGGGGGGNDAAVSIKTLQAAASNTQAAQSSRFVMDMDVERVRREPSPSRPRASSPATARPASSRSRLSVARLHRGAHRRRRRLHQLRRFPGASRARRRAWVQLDLEQLQQRSGVDFGGLADQAQSTSPKQGLEYLQGLSGDVVRSSATRRSAASTPTHYRGSIDYAKVLDELPDAGRRANVTQLRSSAPCRPTCGSTATTGS